MQGVAQVRERLPENVAGEFFVDRTCIDCGTCRQVAPGVYTSQDSATEQSYVYRQPEPGGELRALMALVACPTASIGTVSRLDAKPAVESFPEPIADEVYYCGFAAESSFGARSYLIRRPAGNVLVDSPRAARPLLQRIEELGGVSLMFLTHRDDVADHEKFHARFGCQRILHRDDLTAGTRGVEQKLEGEEPIRLAPDLLAIPVPGHTRGSTVLLYRDKFLFSGDHLWGSERRAELRASRSVSWYSWKEQTRSIEKLLPYRFEWVLPGHGHRFHAPSPQAMQEALRTLISRMR
jgi:glyoxylase-like metal-dependent hydrolase (beta-lactamase superfamily II)/ferredoxin